MTAQGDNSITLHVASVCKVPDAVLGLSIPDLISSEVL